MSFLPNATRNRRRPSFFGRGSAGIALLLAACGGEPGPAAPSHASMFTGLVPGLHGLLTTGERLGDDVPTLARALRRVGFETAAFTSVGFLEGVATGFDTVRAKTSAARAFSSAAITWLKTKRSSPRFFLWMHFYDPHRWKLVSRAPEGQLRAMQAHGEDARSYAEIARLHGLEDPAPGSPFPELEWHSGDRGGEKIHPKTHAEVLSFIDSHDADIAYADAEIERFARALEALDLPGSTLWIVTADHGEGLGSRDYAGHGWQVYSEQLHVSLLFHGSDDAIPAGRGDALVSTVDLLPTVVDLLGGELQGDAYRLGGLSLAAMLYSRDGRGEGATIPLHRQVFSLRRPLRSTGADGVFALQARDAKHTLRMSGEDEFYRLGTDALETENDGVRAGDAARRLRVSHGDWLSAFRAEDRTAANGDESWLEELQKLGYAR